MLYDVAMPKWTEDKGSGYGQTVEYRGRGASRAAKYGAVGVLVRSVTAHSLRTPHTGAMNYEEGVARIPALAGRDVSVLIWTTTPWTIPSNLAVAFHPDFDYGAYEVDGRVLFLATGLADAVAKATGRALGEPILVVKGEMFDKLQKGMTIDLAVEPQINEFNGFTNVELEVKDLQFV